MRFWELMQQQEDELMAARADLDITRRSLRNLSDAYLRLRGLIPGAFNTPYAPTPEEVWETTENALRAALKRAAA